MEPEPWGQKSISVGLEGQGTSVCGPHEGIVFALSQLLIINELIFFFICQKQMQLLMSVSY